MASSSQASASASRVAYSHHPVHPLLRNRLSLHDFYSALSTIRTKFQAITRSREVFDNLDRLEEHVGYPEFGWTTLPLEKRLELVDRVLPALSEKPSAKERLSATTIKAIFTSLKAYVPPKDRYGNDSEILRTITEILNRSTADAGGTLTWSRELLADLTVDELKYIETKFLAGQYTAEEQLLIALHKVKDQQAYNALHEPPRSPLLDSRLTVKVFLDMRLKLRAKRQSDSNGGDLLRRIEKTCGDPGWFWELLTLQQRTDLVGIAREWEENPYAENPPNGSQLLNMIGATHLDALLYDHNHSFLAIGESFRVIAIHRLNEPLASSWYAAMLRELNKITVADLTTDERGRLIRYLHACEAGGEAVILNPWQILHDKVLQLPHPQQTMHSLSRFHRRLNFRQAAYYGTTPTAFAEGRM